MKDMSSPDAPGCLSDWLASWQFWATLCVVGAVPLLYPTIPPLTDLPGHMGRYAVQLDLASSPALQRWYGFQWTLVPNLGVDLIVEALGRWLGLERSVKLIVLAIPVLQMAGYVLVARQAHGRVPATTLFALPLAWCYPFHYGFVNFLLATACATLAFALWLRTAKTRPAVRAAIFAPIGCMLWVMHLYGWGMLCILAACDCFTRALASGRSPLRAIGETAVACAVLLLPIVLKLVLPLPSSGTGATEGFFRIGQKLGWLIMALRDRWMLWDILSVFVLFGVIGWTMASRRFEKYAGLTLATLCFAIAFVLLPIQVFGSYFCDMRLVPSLLAFALIAVRPAPVAAGRAAHWLALAGLAFFSARAAGTTASLYLYGRSYDRELAALDHVPRGAALVTLSWSACSDDQGWAWLRTNHLAGMALVRRHAFANDQWVLPGGQLLSVRFPGAAPFDDDPSMRVTSRPCDTNATSLDRALATIPPVMAYLWIIAPPRLQSPPGWRMLWHDGTSGLYARVRPDT